MSHRRAATLTSCLWIMHRVTMRSALRAWECAKRRAASLLIIRGIRIQSRLPRRGAIASPFGGDSRRILHIAQRNTIGSQRIAKHRCSILRRLYARQMISKDRLFRAIDHVAGCPSAILMSRLYIMGN